MDTNIENQKRNYNVRYSAVKILNRYERSDSYTDKLLAFEFLREDFNKFDKALLTEIVNGVIRWRNKLDWILTGFFYGDFNKNLNWVKNAMRVGLYQLLFLTKIPPPIAIYETVEITKQIQGEKTAGMVNGVLRNILRNIDNIRYPDKEEDPYYYLAVIYSFPKWLMKKWVDQLGYEETEKMLIAMNKRPYIPCRVNQLKGTNKEFQQFLNENEVIFKPYSYNSDLYMIFNPKINFFDSDYFVNGKIAIQDPSAAMAVQLANPQKDWKVIDICAAPGGKSFYMAERMENTGSILSVDKYESKVKLINEGAERLGLTNITTKCSDVLDLDYEEEFDLVFADVPCSGLGTISKKPDIKWKREIDDIIKLNRLQYDLLEAAADMVKPGGVLVYSTCTIEPEENEKIVSKFLERHTEFKLDPAEKYLPEKVCLNGMMATYPHRHSCDGAFAARMLKDAE
ncbi:MAG: 16S rRNA (cytosine(967)-C(5))-methyltransferase [Ignavibacteria bacterium GWF2_33_9]|nr:MAG: 16S rRNA (cytosine(967)-C(5))-methyltransferase [Ignavibacteria bacterium GWF2_33_9]